MLDLSKYVGIPFVDGGRDFEGADCWGLLALAYKEEFGIDLPHYTISAMDTEEVIDAMSDSMERGEWQPVTQYKEGDVVAMSLHPKYPEMINHVGLLVGTASFLHTQEKTGAIISPMNHMLYSKTIRGVYRWAI